MAGYKSLTSPADSRGHQKRLSADDTILRDRMQQKKRADQELEQTRDDFTQILTDVYAQHEQQVEQQQAHYNLLEAEHRQIRKENTRLQEQRCDLQEECTKLKEQRVETEKNYKKLEEQYKGIAKQKSNIEHKYKHVNSRYIYLVQKVVESYAQNTGLKWDDQTGETIDVVLDPLVGDALEAGNLRDQVRVLQKEVFARVDKGDAISDEQFAREFRNLTALIKTLSRTVRLPGDVDIVEMLGAPMMLEGVAPHHWTDRARKKCMIEAWVWSVLLCIVFDTPFGILGHQGVNLKELWTNMFGFDHAHDWPTPSSLCEIWRYTTMEHIFGRMVAQDVVTQGKEKGEVTVQEQSVLEVRDHVSQVIKTELGKVSATIELKQIRQIIDKAFALAAQVSIQRSRLQVTYPSVGDTFDDKSMISMPSSDGEDFKDGIVAFVVNPGLTKWGDAHGKHLGHRYDIVPALVCLEPVTIEQSLDKAFADMDKREV